MFFITISFYQNTLLTNHRCLVSVFSMGDFQGIRSLWTKNILANQGNSSRKE